MNTKLSPYVMPGLPSEMTKDYNIMFSRVLRIVSDVFGVGEDDIKGRRRVRKYADARRATMYLVRENTRLSYEAIGKVFNRDHATILHACRSCVNLRETDGKFDMLLRLCELRLKG